MKFVNCFEQLYRHFLKELINIRAGNISEIIGKVVQKLFQENIVLIHSFQIFQNLYTQIGSNFYKIRKQQILRISPQNVE